MGPSRSLLPTRLSHLLGLSHPKCTLGNGLWCLWKSASARGFTALLCPWASDTGDCGPVGLYLTLNV